MADEITVPGKTVPELIEYWGCTAENDITAFVSINASGQKWTINRKDVLEVSKRFAHRLHSFGIKKGDIVCNAVPNSLERVVSEFGTQFSGAASMNGQILRSDCEDFFDALKTSQCVAVIVDINVLNRLHHVLFKDVPFDCENIVQSEYLPVQSEYLPHLKRLILCRRDDNNSQNDFITSLRNPQLPQYSADVAPTDLATVMTTSGSTGYSKLVKLTQANICHFFKQVKAIEPLFSGAHFVNCAQLGWAGGYPQWYLSCGVTRHFIDMLGGPPPDVPTLLWKIIVQEKIVYGFVTPMFVNAILTKCQWQNSEWIPIILCLAGQPIKKGHLEIIGKLCRSVDVNYGMTECNVVTTHRIFDPYAYVDGCAGYPGYGVKIKIVDVNKQEVSQGTTGEILLKSPSLCSGYLNNESASASAFTSDGWFCTDDAGYLGSDGKVYVEGRQSDSIHRGVYILYPGWLEKKMREFPGVNDIAVVAVPDPVLFNEICACIVVSGVTGVVAGCLDGTASNFSPVLAERSDSGSNKSLVASTEQSVSSSSRTEETDSVEQKDVTTSQGQEINEKFSVLSLSTNDESKDSSTLNLAVFEEKLRKFADDLNILHQNDVMRMVPKYYVFMDTFPMTNTGKISRKELRRIAAAALGL